MEYSEYKDQAAGFMRLAIPLMKKHGVAMTPDNYAVWYEYVVGGNVALCEAVDDHIDESQQLSDQQSRVLYERFFDKEKDHSALQVMRQDLKRVLSEVLLFISTGVESSKNTTEHLTSIISSLQPNMSPQDVRNVLKDVITESRSVVSTSEQLSQRLDATITEVNNLRKDLDEAKHEAKTDSLTKLSNRKAFDMVIQKATTDADNGGLDVSMIFADLDFFKSINDNHGHLVGDQVLKVVARSLRGAVKGRDLVARYGGEEFAIILLSTSISNTTAIAENIRKDIAAKQIQRRDSKESLGKITMSFGVAQYVPSEGPESFMQRADRALYMSKRNGRNMVSEAAPPSI